MGINMTDNRDQKIAYMDHRAVTTVCESSDGSADDQSLDGCVDSPSQERLFENFQCSDLQSHNLPEGRWGLGTIKTHEKRN